MRKYLYFYLFLLAPIVAGANSENTVKPNVDVNVIVSKFENGLRNYYLIDGEPNTANIKQQMDYYKIPGVSVAAIHDGHYVFVKAYGYKDSSTKQPLTTQDLLQAASMSKPITILGALKLVSQGQLNLDSNINNYLNGWKVESNQYTTAHPVTAGLLMAHLGGTNVPGFPGINSSVKKLPDIIDVLNGKKPLITTDPVSVIQAPGTKFAYSGGGISILQLAMMDISKQSFASYMKENVLTPFAMNQSTFQQPLPESYQSFASSGHDKSGLVYKGRYHNYPEEAAAGLWTNPAEIIGILNHLKMAYYGHCSPLNIESTLFTRMFTLQKPSPYGLGFVIESTPQLFAFGHDGGNDGFQSKMIAFVTPHGAKGQFFDDAIVVMTNSDNGHYILEQLVNSFSDVYAIPYHPTIKVKPQPLPANLTKYQVSFFYPDYPKQSYSVIVKNSKLYLDWFHDGYLQQLYYTGNGKFITASGYNLSYGWAKNKPTLTVQYQNNSPQAVFVK